MQSVLSMYPSDFFRFYFALIAFLFQDEGQGIQQKCTEQQSLWVIQTFRFISLMLQRNKLIHILN